MKSNKEMKLDIISAARKAVEQLIKVAKEDIIKPDPEDDISADRLKNAAATKKLAISPTRTKIKVGSMAMTRNMIWL